MPMQNQLEEYYRRSSNALRLVRYIVLLIFILFLLSCIFLFRNDITLDNIQYLMKYADFYGSSDTNDTSDISISADSESQMLMLRDNLAVISKSGIGLYEFSGRKLFNYNFSYSNPGIAYDDRNILVYDISGTEISIFNSFSRVYSQKYPYSVKSGCINDSGFAIVTNEKTYRSGVIAYNSKYEEVFRWMSADRYVSALALNDIGTRLACCAVTSQNGVYDTKIIIYDLTSGEVDSEISLSDELPLKIVYSEDSSRIILITDSMIHFYNTKLEDEKTYKYNQSKIDKYFLSDRMVVISESNNLSGNSMTLIGFDYSGQQLFSENADSKVSDISIGKDMLYALSPQYVYCYAINDDLSVEPEGKFATGSQYRHILSDSSDRYIVADTKSAHRSSVEDSQKELAEKIENADTENV